MKGEMLLKLTTVHAPTFGVSTNGLWKEPWKTVCGREEGEVFGFSSPIGDQLPWTSWLCCPAPSTAAWEERSHALCLRKYIPSGAWLACGNGTTWALKEEVGTEEEWVTEGPVHRWGRENLRGFCKINPTQFTPSTAQIHSCPSIIFSSNIIM